MRADTTIRHITTVVLSLVYFGLGSCFYMEAMGWTLNESLYFLMTTASTVGYGDLNPSTDRREKTSLAVRQFVTVLLIFFGICVIFARLSNLIASIFKPLFRHIRDILEKIFPQETVDIDGDGVADFKLPRSATVFYSKNLLAPVLLTSVVQLSCAWIFTKLIDVDFGTALYHCLSTATTVGYGDVAMTTEAAKTFAFFHILISVSLLAAIISDVGELGAERRNALKRMHMFESRLDTDLMASLDQNGDGVDKFEFVTGMLIQMNLLDAEDVGNFVKLFEEMDKDGSGTLTADDMEEFRAIREAEKAAVLEESTTGGALSSQSVAGMGMSRQGTGGVCSASAVITDPMRARSSVIADPMRATEEAMHGAMQVGQTVANATQVGLEVGQTLTTQVMQVMRSMSSRDTNAKGGRRVSKAFFAAAQRTGSKASSWC